MDSCDHKPQLGFKAIFNRLPQYKCRNCGEKIRMTKTFRTVNRILNAIVLVAAVFLAFNNKGNTSGTVDWIRFAINIGLILGIFVLYLVIQILLLKFASYEVEPSPEVQEPVEDIIDVTEAEEPEYTQEQIEIMERYAALESQSMTDAETDSETEKVVEVDKVSVEDICDHTPAKTWKNYIPSKYDFTCDKCGKPIVFAPPVKKRMNILLLVVVLVILMPSSINLSVDFWKFGLLSLLVLVIGVAIQFFFVRRGPFVDKDQDDSKKK